MTVQCQTCYQEVQERAWTCPHCGDPTPTPYSRTIKTSGFIVAMLVIVVVITAIQL